MRDLSTKKIEFGEHVMMDGVECVVVDGECENCEWESNCVISAICPIGGKLEKVKKVKKEPSYRPYNNTEEMIADWKNRFLAGQWQSYAMPLVWVMFRLTNQRILITAFNVYSVVFNGITEGLRDLFDNYTYLDGSPCGKKI